MHDIIQHIKSSFLMYKGEGCIFYLFAFAFNYEKRAGEGRKIFFYSILLEYL